MCVAGKWNAVVRTKITQLVIEQMKRAEEITTKPHITTALNKQNGKL